MTEEEKHLLLVDLCARLPYGVICKSKSYKNILFNSSHISLIESEEIKPYLRPMSSMAEEEKKEFHHVASLKRNYLDDDIFYTHWQMYDWLNKNHFDYRSLIPKELALEAPNNMYKI